MKPDDARYTYIIGIHYLEFLNIVFFPIALLLIFGSFFAWETRKVQIEALNDSKEIGICVYNIMIMSVISVPISRMLPLLQMDVSFGVISISVLVCAVTTLLLVFGPKVWTERDEIIRTISITPGFLLFFSLFIFLFFHRIFSHFYVGSMFLTS